MTKELKILIGILALSLVIFGSLLIGVLVFAEPVVGYDEYTHLNGIEEIQQVVNSEDEFYLYFYYDECHYCQNVKKYIPSYADDIIAAGTNYYFVDIKESGNENIMQDAGELLGLKLTGTPSIVNVSKNGATLLNYVEELEPYGFKLES